MDATNNTIQAVTANISTTKTLKVYSGVAARLLSQLSGGANQREAAAACGVTEGFVSQLMAEEDFKAQLKINFEKATQRAIEIDNNYEDIEKTATDSLKKLIPLVHSPSELMKIAIAANGAKKKFAPKVSEPDGSGASGGRVVNIIMPQVILNNFSMNPNSEIVAVGERTLTTLNAASITSLMNQHKDAKLVEQEAELSKPALLEQKAPNAKDKWSNL